ncbi:MAG TPA: extracellular solute-binding protein [Chloroflexota bacterium]|nr:extracellular solute-binding protein [Chloroflexota bacterium]
MFKKQCLALLACLLFLPGFLTGGHLASARAADRAAAGAVTLTMLTHWDATTLQAFQPYVKTYEALHPNVHIQITTVPFNNLLQKISTSLLSNGGFDIYHIYDLWLPQLVKDHLFAPAPATQASDIKAGYALGIASAASANGTLYGYPTEVDDYALIYNKRLFAAAHISHPPTNWSELVSDAVALTKRDSSGRTIQQGFGTITGWDSGVVHPWLSLLLSDGGHLLNSSNVKAAFNSPQGLETLNLYQTLVSKHAIDPSMTLHYDTNFELEKTGMIIMANWWESGLQATMKSKFKDVGVVPIPVGPHGTKSVAVNYVWMYGVNQKSSHQAEAWQFLQWLNDPARSGASSRMGDWLMAQGIVPSRASDQHAHAADLGNSFAQPFVKALATSRPFPIVLGGAEITTDLQKQIESVVYSRSSPRQALSTAESQVNTILQGSSPD